MNDAVIERSDFPVAAPESGRGVGACVANFVDPWVRMVGQYSGHRIAFPGNLAVTLSNTDCAFLNIITLQAPVVSSDTLREDIELARQHASACSGPAMLSVCTSWLPPGGVELIASTGAGPAMTMIGMAADSLSPPRREEAPLDWRLVEDEQTGRDLGIVNAEAYGLDHAVMAVSAEVHRWSPRAFAVVGYEDRRAVTGALAMVFEAMSY